MSLSKICLARKSTGLALISTLIFAVAEIFIPGPAFADDLSDCTQASDLPRVIVGCTNLLSARTIPHDNSAIAYRNRSSAYAALGDFERAEQDYRHAIALNPHYLGPMDADILSTAEPHWLNSAPDP